MQPPTPATNDICKSSVAAIAPVSERHNFSDCAASSKVICLSELNPSTPVGIKAVRLFRPGTYEIIVGASIAARFANTGIAQHLTFAQREWTVVVAMIGAMITMYASVASRIGEIGTLRALGFRRGAVLWAFMAEAILLGAGGGALGLALAALMQFASFSTINFQTFADLSFHFRKEGPHRFEAIVSASRQ